MPMRTPAPTPRRPVRPTAAVATGTAPAVLEAEALESEEEPLAEEPVAEAEALAADWLPVMLSRAEDAAAGRLVWLASSNRRLLGMLVPERSLLRSDVMSALAPLARELMSVPTEPTALVISLAASPPALVTSLATLMTSTAAAVPAAPAPGSAAVAAAPAPGSAAPAPVAAAPTSEPASLATDWTSSTTSRAWTLAESPWGRRRTWWTSEAEAMLRRARRPKAEVRMLKEWLRREGYGGSRFKSLRKIG
ncbi:hypothetical protein BKA81DRAFT_199434 [Phyllosticta paracitricarpa]|uniref:Uncharacterized protein n=1 Tax=Phyllosticta paracitricarpa TaxID=2016321 RepID=A0ABR1MUM4_9PEZI